MGTTERACPGCGDAARTDEGLCATCGALIDGLAAEPDAPGEAPAGSPLAPGPEPDEPPQAVGFLRRSPDAGTTPTAPSRSHAAAGLGPLRSPGSGPSPIPGADRLPPPPPPPPPTPSARTPQPRSWGPLIGRAVLALVLVGALVGAWLAVKHQRDETAQAAERKQYLAAHSSTPQGPPGLARVLQDQARRNEVAGRLVGQFCNQRKPVPSQPAFKPGDTSQWYMVDGNDFEAATMAFRYSSNQRGRSTLAVCSTDQLPVDTGVSCTYYPIVGTFGEVDRNATPSVRKLQLERIKIDVYEIRTGSRLGGDVVTAPGDCPERARQGIGPVTSKIEGGVSSWVTAHLSGATIH